YRIHQRNKFPWVAFGGGHHGLDPRLLGPTHFAAILAASVQTQPKRSQHFANTQVAHSKRHVSLNFAPEFPNATEYEPEHKGGHYCQELKGDYHVRSFRRERITKRCYSRS